MSSEILFNQRNITEILHFTTHFGILGTLAKGALMSREQLPKDDYLEHILQVNSKSRPEEAEFFDKSENWLNYVNLSLSEINKRFFDVSQRWHKGNSDIWWGILSFNANIIAHPNVYFATTNNGYEHCQRNLGGKGFEALFVPKIKRKENWCAYRGTRRDTLPTCEQAELLYPEQLLVKHLQTIYVQNGDQYDLTRTWLLEFNHRHVNVVICPEKFTGSPN